MALRFRSDFNPPIPCGMGRVPNRGSGRDTEFQSTHPVWDGTPRQGFRQAEHLISIHPSRVGWDGLSISTSSGNAAFQSTHPVWDGTWRRSTSVEKKSRFQSTHPVWDGTAPCIISSAAITFQSTHPVWDGTRELLYAGRVTCISIHPSRVGWDLTKGADYNGCYYFNPPIPCGMGPGFIVAGFFFRLISIHPSRVGWDSKKYMITYISCDSYPFCQIFRLHKMTAYSYS